MPELIERPWISSYRCPLTDSRTHDHDEGQVARPQSNLDENGNLKHHRKFEALADQGAG